MLAANGVLLGAFQSHAQDNYPSLDRAPRIPVLERQEERRPVAPSNGATRSAPREVKPDPALVYGPPSPADLAASAPQRPKNAPRPIVDVVTERLSIDDVIDRLRQPSLSFVTAKGVVFDPENRAIERGAGAPSPSLSEPTIIGALTGASLSEDQARELWSAFADTTREGLPTPDIVEAVLRATDTVPAGEMMWDALAGATTTADRNGSKSGSLLNILERNRKRFVPLLATVTEPLNAEDNIMSVVLSSKVFGATQDESVIYMAGQKPATIARRIEREREQGKPVWWEFTAFREMMRWRRARFLPNAPHAPTTLAQFDAISESFVTIFNCLHGLEPWYREQIMQGITPADLYNIAVSGEQELYRLGTSGFRQYLYPTILKGITDEKSFEAFLQKASLVRLGQDAVDAGPRRALVFLRIASSFGLLDSVIEAVQDRDSFLADALAALGDPRALEGSGAVVMDLLTARSTSATTIDFKKALLDQLYERYRSADRRKRVVYGSILSTYQALTEDRREASIDRDFPIDRTMIAMPFDRLFSRDRGGRLVHRMFMRFDNDIDATRTHAAFRGVMSGRGARVRVERHHEVYTLTGKGRTIEIYANKPTQDGITTGIVDLARQLEGLRIETVVGRGHTGIVTALQRDSRRILGTRIKDVASVIVGTCGGNASIRQMIDTFGYVPFVASKSTGRMQLNNAIISTYLDALFAIPSSDRLALQSVLDRAMAPFLSQRDTSIGDDARLYVVNLSTALSAYMFDKHVRQSGDAGE